jgi:radical SAM protein with 4Fe4S-binding SPASM domain
MELKNDIFIINTQRDRYIIYAPLRHAAFFANQKATAIVQKYIDEKILSNEERETKVWEYLQNIENTEPIIPKENSINTEKSLVIILSQLCNLACTYCYALESRSKEVLSKEKLQKVIDYVLSQPNDEKKRFSFIGGGEPTVTWELLEWAIKYIYASKKENQEIQCSITTNGTLLSDEKISFLKSYKVRVGISFEILPEIQNAQRKYPNPQLKSFDTVNEAIRILQENNVPYSFRSTITKRNVHLMKDMVSFVSENYKKIKRLHFEQVTDVQDNDSEFYNCFIENFFEARKIGKEKGIEVYNSISNSVNSLRSRFCRGEFCVTPTGDIISCHRVSSDKESSFEYFHYGYIDNQIHIDNAKIGKVLKLSKHKKKECEDCFAKWHCAGSCTSEKLLLSEQQQLYKCDFTKKIITRILEEKLSI